MLGRLDSYQLRSLWQYPVAPYIFAYKHFLAQKGKEGAEKIAHWALLFFEVLPVVNFAVALLDAGLGCIKRPVPPSPVPPPTQGDRHDIVPSLPEQYRALRDRLQRETEEGYIAFREPTRRHPNPGLLANTKLAKQIKGAEFVADNQIIQRHPMQFLRSPAHRADPLFPPLDSDVVAGLKRWPEVCLDSLRERQRQLQAIARTKEGKYVVLQQAARSCVPSAVAMLVLDRKQSIDDLLWQAVCRVDLATKEDAEKWIKAAGLEPLDAAIEHISTTGALSDLLQKNGPEILGIDDHSVGGHVVVLDAIQHKEATIRDSLHGWMITVQLEVVEAWVQKDRTAYFLQIQSHNA